MNSRQQSVADFVRHLMHIVSCAAASFAACQYALGVNLISKNVAGMFGASIVAALWYAYIGERRQNGGNLNAHQ